MIYHKNDDDEGDDFIRKFFPFDDPESVIEENYEKFKYASLDYSHPRSFHHRSAPHYAPPVYHYLPPAPAPPPPSYHHPPPYKAIYEVDFTPLFLALLPVFLVLGTLLGLALTGLSSTASTISYVGTNGTGRLKSLIFYFYLKLC